MVEISKNGIITITRGDYFEVPLFINQGDKLYPIRYELSKDSTTTIMFIVSAPNQGIENAIIRKIYTVNSPHTDQGDLIIGLTSEETITLPPGKYYYSIIMNRLNNHNIMNNNTNNENNNGVFLTPPLPSLQNTSSSMGGNSYCKHIIINEKMLFVKE